MTHLITPPTTLEDIRSTLGQIPNSKPLYPLDPCCHSRTLAHSPKISLNTSKRPKRKNVQKVEAHNFVDEWHLKFGGILGEKALEGVLLLFTGAEN
jgi:hypothetical protein